MDEKNIVEQDRYAGESVMIWEGSGKTELAAVNGRLNACRYCDEIIIPVVIPILQRGRADVLRTTTPTAMLFVTQCSALLQQSDI